MLPYTLILKLIGDLLIGPVFSPTNRRLRLNGTMYLENELQPLLGKVQVAVINFNVYEPTSAPQT